MVKGVKHLSENIRIAPDFKLRVILVMMSLSPATSLAKSMPFGA